MTGELAQADLVGRWELVAWETRIGEQLVRPMGDEPVGVLLYTGDGFMVVQAMTPGRARIGTGDPLGGSVEERAAAYAGCLAYCGRWELRDDGTILHRIELSLFPNWVGAQQVREVELGEDGLVLRTPPIDSPAGKVVSALRWRRTV